MKQETQSPSVPIQMAIMGGLPSKKQERLLRLKDFLNSNYELRFNVVSRQTEVRLKYSKDDFTDVTKRTLNGIVNNAIERGGLEISDRDVSRMIESAYAPDFHPMTSYVSSLPDWDGVDRVTPLAQRISPQELWVKVFHIWMRAMTAQWMGTETECANTLVPVLVSREQGMRRARSAGFWFLTLSRTTIMTRWSSLPTATMRNAWRSMPSSTSTSSTGSLRP